MNEDERSGKTRKELSTKPEAHRPDPPIGVKALALGCEMQALKEIEYESNAVNARLRQKCIWFVQGNAGQ